MPGRSQPTVERSIYFYRMDFGLDESGKPIAGDIVPALRHIDSLHWTAEGRYLDIGEGNVLCCWLDAVTPRPRIRLATSRRSALPLREQAGHLSAIPIPPNAGLVEPIHIEFFPSDIVGAEFNFYGPRVSRLGEYLAVKAHGVGKTVSFQPLMRRDAQEKLARLQDIRLFQLKVHAPFANTVQQADQDLGTAFQAARQAGNAGELEIILRPTAYARGATLAPKLLTAARIIARIVGLREQATKFVVGGLDSQTEKVETIDVLRDQLITKQQIVSQGGRTRALDDASAYSAIEEAYSQLRDELLAAAGMAR